LHDADAGNLDSFLIYTAKQLAWSLELSIKAGKNESIEEVEDWKKKTALLKKQLADKDTIKIIKSVEALTDLINSKIVPFLFAVMKDLKEFDDLFLGKRFRFYTTTGYRNLPIDVKFNSDQVSKFFQDNFLTKLTFDDFTKDPDNPFSLDLNLNSKFLKHKYELEINDSIVFTRLYHQEFTKVELEETMNVIGRFIISGLEQKLNLS